MQALVERTDYSLLAMGRSREKGCFCPANTLLREAIDFLSDPFAAILIDAEAGLEQIQRRVTRNVTQIIAISDGSQRSRDIIKYMSEMVGHQKLVAVTNRVQQNTQNRPYSCELLGSIPEDDILRQLITNINYDAAADLLYRHMIWENCLLTLRPTHKLIQGVLL